MWEFTFKSIDNLRPENKYAVANDTLKLGILQQAILQEIWRIPHEC